jgi:CSLREA domain-containing protein
MRPLSRHWLIFLLFLLIAATAAVSLKFVLTPAYAAGLTYTVNSTADTDDGVCDATNCTLREAINAANAHAGADTINFSVSGTITLGSASPTISDALTIDGAGQTITLDGAHQHTVLFVPLGPSLSLKNLTIINGTSDECADPSHCDGGAIFTGFTDVSITNCSFSNNSASGFGGAIANTAGTLVVTNSTFSNNTAGNTGAAICGGFCASGGTQSISGSVTVTNSTFSNNHASNDGGAISINGTLDVTNSNFSGNNSKNLGGAIAASQATLNVTDSSFSGNSGAPSISTDTATVTISGSTFSGNTAGGMAIVFSKLSVANSIFSNNTGTGGLFTFGTTAVVGGSTFSGNQSDQLGGAIVAIYDASDFSEPSRLDVSTTTFSGNTASSNTQTATGGAIFNDGYAMRVTDCSFSGNAVSSDSQPAQGGAIYNSLFQNTGSLEVSNSTFALNSSSSKTNSASGGAIYNKGALLNITNSTLAENSVSAASGFAGSGGGIYIESLPSGSLKNTIIANSTSGGDCAIASGALTGTHNLIMDSSNACGLINGVNGNLIGSDPLLGPFANNGGPTSTYALLFGSPAIDAGTDETTLNGAISDTTTSIVVADATPFPAAVGFVIRVDDEKMVVVGKASNTLTVTRHANGTTAATHTAGAAVNAAFDQRGGQRKFGATIDIGAYEFGPAITPSGTIHLCPGGRVLLTSSIAAGNQWYLNGNPIAGATSQQYLATAVGDYTVVVTIGGVSSDPSLPVTVTFNSPPAPPPAPTITAGGPTLICDGSSVTLTSSSADDNQWYLNGNPISGATAQQYVASAAGDYSAVVINACVSASSNQIHVTVNPVPPVPTITPGGPTTFPIGGSVMLTSSSATGNQWLLNGNTIAGATGQQYQATASGDYTVSVTDNICVSVSAPITVTTTPDPDRFVATGGTDGGNDCLDIASPCATIQYALNLSPYGVIHVAAGLYTQGAIVFTGDATILGSNGTTVTADFQVSSNNRKVTLRHLTIIPSATQPYPIGATNIVVGGTTSLTLDHCTIAATPNNRIFAVDHTASLTINDSMLSNGSAVAAGSSGGGCIYDSGTLVMSNTSVTGCNATFGGAILVPLSGSATITDSTFDTNTASFDGGAIESANSSTLSVSGSTFKTNSATSGGAIYNFSAAATITNSTFSGNNASNSLLSQGGGIYNKSGSLTVNNSTFVNNSAAELGGAIFDNIGTLTLNHTILAGSPAGGDFFEATPPQSTVSGSYNLIQDGSFLNLFSNSLSGDPKLGPLQNNGGSTQTCLLLPGSQAINGGDPAFASPPANDQRGFLRVINGRVDIGAVEVNYSIAAMAGNNQSATINTAFATTLQATVEESNVVQINVPVTFTPPASGASGAFSGASTVRTNASGIATAPTFTANVTAGGPYNVVAGLANNLATVNFALTNTAANQTITVNTHAPASALFNAQFTVAATASSGLPVSYSSAGSCTNVGPTFTITNGTGTCSAIYNQGGNGNFNAAPPVTETVSAQKANQTITFNSITNKTFGDADFSVGSTASSGLPVSLSATGNCTVTTPAPGNVHITGAGSCTITASQAGDSNYNAATNVPQVFTIVKANQTITFNSLANKTFGDADFTVSATASSNLAVSFTAGGNCSISTNTVHLTGAGLCTVTAKQAGDSNFNAAADVPQTFAIAPAPTTTAVSSSANPSNVTQNVTFAATVTGPANTGTPTGSVTFKDGPAAISCANAGGQTLNASGVATCQTATLTAGTHLITAVYAGDANFQTSTGTLSSNQVVNNLPLVSFSTANYNVNESDGIVHVMVTRAGDTSVPFNLDYATSDTGASVNCGALNTGLASSRCDFTTTLGTLKFAANQTQAAIDITINQDGYAEGAETFTVNLSNPTAGALLFNPSNATVTINDSTSPAPNAIDDTNIFVRQQYHDFLNREPDAAGLAFWKQNIDKCNDTAQLPPGQTIAQCIETQRVITSAAFFLSIEFNQTGTFVRSFYVAALDRPATNNMPEIREWLRDTQAVQRNVVVGQGNWQTTLDANRLAFMQDFVMRPEFVGLYQTTDTPTQYVDKLYQHAAMPPSNPGERAAAIAEFGAAATASDPAARGRALLDITQNPTFQARELPRAFVQIQYFGYLRRNPNDLPDGNFNGYNFWLNKLNQFNGDFLQAEMVKAFLTSTEYRRRFGP